MRCVLDPGDAIVDCPPTFTMYVFDAAVNDARVVTVPRLKGFALDVEGELSSCWRPAPGEPSGVHAACAARRTAWWQQTMDVEPSHSAVVKD